MPLIQDIFRQYGPLYLQKFARNMPTNHKKVLRAIMNCRSKALGGQIFFCETCNVFRYSYHSCGNRHCIICQNNKAEEWLKRQKRFLLPLTYFLATFTLPEDLRKCARQNQKLIYNQLFKAAADAVKLLAKDKKYLGAETGMIGILHTWARNLAFHPHVHFLIPGGGLSLDEKRFRFSDDDFLMHVKPLSKIFRAKFRDLLKEKDRQLFKQIPKQVWNKDWVVHIKSVGNGQQTLSYMARYVFRVAISNSRIVKLDAGKVTYKYSDSKSGKVRFITVEAFEFIRRFMQHVLPHNFMKVRYYGFYAAANRKKLATIRKLLFVDEESAPEKNPGPNGTKKVKVCCPVCGQVMAFIEEIPRIISVRAP